jgi:hypothetical protein
MGYGQAPHREGRGVRYPAWVGEGAMPPKEGGYLRIGSGGCHTPHFAGGGANATSPKKIELTTFIQAATFTRR